MVRATILVLLFLALHAVGSWFFPAGLWGVSAPGYLGGLGAAFLMLAALLVVPQAGASAARGAARGWAWLDAPSPGRASRLSAVAAAGFVAFVLLRSQNHYLGDGFFRLGELRDELVRLHSADLLDLYLHEQVWHYLKALGSRDPSIAYWLPNALAGAIWLALLPAFARRLLPENARSRWTVPLFFLTSGTVLFFFGYVECYTFRELLVLLYLLLAMDALAGRSWLPAAGALLVACAMHPSSLALLPSFLVLLWAWSERGDGRTGARRATALALGLLASGGAFAAAIRVATFRGGGSSLLPLRAGPDAAYGLFSFAHFTDLANVALLAAPGAVLLLLFAAVSGAFRLPRTPRAFFWSAAVAGPALLVFLLEPKLGSRDWDLLALPATPALAAAILLTFGSDARSRARPTPAVAAAFLGATLLHTGSWVLVNHDAQRGVRMVLDFVSRDPHHLNGPSPRLMNVGVELNRQGHPREARELLERAVALRPDDYWSNFNLGTLLMEQRQVDEAVPYLEHAVEVSTTEAGAAIQLGTIHGRAGRFEEAIRYFLMARERAPRDGNVRWNLGLGYLKSGKTEEGVRELEEARRLSPRRADIPNQLAWEYYKRGDTERAAEAASAALALEPSRAAAHYVLAGCQLARGDRERALWSFRTAATLSPDSEVGAAARAKLDSLEASATAPR